MQTITTIGLDIAKPVFQVHGVDAERQCNNRPAVEKPLCPEPSTHEPKTAALE